MKSGLGKKMSIVLLTFLISLVVKAQDTQVPIDLTLEKAITIALSENPSVKIADLEVQKKKYAKQSAQSALYPQIDAVGQYSRAVKKQVMYMGGGGFNIEEMLGSTLTPIIAGTNKTLQDNISDYDNSLGTNIEAARPSAETSSGDGGIVIGKDNQWVGGFEMTWPIVTPTLWKSLEITSLDLELAVEEARSSKLNMVNSIRKAYYGALLAKDIHDVYQQSYDNAFLTYNDINNKYTQGLVAEFDLIRADVNAKNIKPNLIQAQNAYNIAILSLKALMGIDMDQEITVNGSLLNYEQDLYAEILSIDSSLESNSDLKKFDIQAEQLQKSLELYKRQYYPTIAITGNYMTTSMYDDADKNRRWNPSSTVGVAVKLPIFDGFKKHKDIQQTKVSLEQMKWQREDIVRNLKLTVDNNLNNMTNYVEQVFSTKDVVIQAQKGYEISQKLYDTGMGTLLDLNTAQLGLTQASLAFTQAIYNFLASKADLDKTLGIEINE